MALYRVTGALFFLASFLVCAFAQQDRPRGPVVRQVDQVSVECGNPQALYRFFTETLQLPAVTALKESGQYTSGSIGAGNLLLEIYHYQNKPVESARYASLSYEPYPNALRELKARSIPYADPVLFEGTLPNGTKGALWTRTGLPSFSQEGTSYFLFEYSPLFLNTAVRRKQIINRIVLQQGGPLGFDDVKRIVIASTDRAKDAEAWKKLLGRQDPSGIWTAGSGPSIQIVQGSNSGIRELIFKVRSLDQARSFLKKSRLLGQASSRFITVNPARIQGLRIRLEE